MVASLVVGQNGSFWKQGHPPGSVSFVLELLLKEFYVNGPVWRDLTSQKVEALVLLLRRLSAWELNLAQDGIMGLA